MDASLSKPFFVRLGPRGRVRVAGADRLSVLQAIVSNDLGLLGNQLSVYSCLLTPQGKFLHDFFVGADGDSLLLDCEPGVRAADLLAKIRPYKLRSKVELAVEPDANVYAILNRPEAPELGEGYEDLRHPALGWRTAMEPAGIEEQPFAVWDERRIRLAIPDGSRDMDVGKDTLLECNIDTAHGVSFGKGCYVGQEITARMHLRGLVKKHLQPVSGPALPAPFTDIVIGGQLAGQMRSSCNGVGLALLKDDSLPLLESGTDIRLLDKSA